MKNRISNFSGFGWGLFLTIGISVFTPLRGADIKHRGKPEPAPKFVFYPPAPEVPRIQFLVSFSSEADFGSGQSKFARFIVGKEPPKRNIVKPYGLAMFKGKLFVCDTGQRSIEVLDLEQWKFTYYTPRNSKPLNTPLNLALDHDGTLYVTDRGYNQVFIYNADSEFVGAIGMAPMPKAFNAPKKSKPATTVELTGQIWPTDVVLSSNRVYVTDLKDNTVKVYDKASRDFCFQIPRDRTNVASKLFAPTNLALDSRGRLYVSDMGGFCIKQFDPEGNLLNSFGKLGDRLGQFSRPKGIAVDREGRLYAVDAAAQVVQIFDADGKVLLFFGEPDGSPVPLNLPAKVIIDYDNLPLFQKYAAPNFRLEYLIIVSNQLGDRKVSVYGYGQQL